jgi:hypothetical protein
MPEILIMSAQKRSASHFQLEGGKDNAERLFQMFDAATYGRLENATCEVIEKMSQQWPTFVFFGEPELLKKDLEEGWGGVAQMAYSDRRDYPHEPMNFVWNNDEECKKTYGASEHSEVTYVLFDPGFMPTIEGDPSKMQNLKSYGAVKKWTRHALIKHERQWNYRQLMTFEDTAQFMVAYMPTKEQWDEEREFKEDTGRNGIQV